MGNEQRIVELVIDGSGTEAGINRTIVAYDHLGDRAAAATAKAQAAMAQQMRIFDTNVPQAIDRAGAAYDKLRAKTDPVLSAQIKLETEMTRSLGVINRAILLGVTTEQQANSELMKLRQQQVVQLDQVRAAHDALALRTENLREKFDSSYVASNKLTADLRDLADAEKMGIQISGGYASALDQLILKHDAVAAAAAKQALEYRALAQAGRDAYSADKAQSQINSQLGVRDGSNSGAAAASGAVFEEQLRRSEQIAQLRSQQQGQNFATDVNQWAGINGNGTSARASASVFEDAARETEILSQKAAALRAQLDPVGASQARVNSEIAEYQKLASASVISTEEMSKGELLAKARHDEYVQSLNKAPKAAVGTPNYQTANVAAQFQDIGVTAAMGMSPLQIALQQGTQLSMALGETGGGLLGGVKALGAGFLSLLSPVSLVTIGLVAGAAALIEYFSASTKPLKTMDDAIKAHADSVDILKNSYGQLGDTIKVSMSIDGKSGSDAVLRANEVVMRAVARQQTDKLAGTLSGSDTWGALLSGNSGNSVTPLTKLAGPQAAFKAPVDALLDSVRKGAPDLKTFNDSVENTFQTLLGSSDNTTELRATADAIKAIGTNALTVSSSIKVLGADGKEVSQSLKPFESAIDRLRVGIADGHPDLAQFNADVENIGLAKGLGPVADQVIVLGKEVLNLNVQLKDLQIRKSALFNDQGPTGTLLSQGTTNSRDMGNYDAFKQQQEIAAARDAQSVAAQIATINARSSDERATAAGATAAATYNDSETPAQVRQRVEDAIVLSQVQSEKQLSDAQKDRAQSLSKLLDDQRLETSLLGQTSSAAADLRQQYDLTATLRQEANRNGITSETEFQKVYGKEIETNEKIIQQLRQMTDERTNMMSRTVAAANAQQYQAGNADNLADLQRTQAAALGAIGAKTPQQLAEAARARVHAEPVNPTEDPSVRQYREDSAAALALAGAENQLKEAQRTRALNYDKILDDQRNEIALVGQTGGAAAALRKEYELTSQLRLEAAQRGAQADEGELAKIHEKAKALGDLTDVYNKAKLNDDLQFERSQLSRNEGDQQIASRQRGAGVPVDLNSGDAQFMRKTAQIDTVRTGVKTFFSDFEQTLVSNGGKAGQALGTALKNALLSSVEKLADHALDKLVNFFTDAILQTGGKSSASSVAGIGTGAIGVAGKVLGGTAANDNSAAPTTSIAAYIAKAATARGIDPSTALAVAKSEGGLTSWNQQSGVFKNGVQEPSFGPFQLYKGGGLGNEFQKQTGLDPANASSGPAGIDFALDHAKENGWGSWYGAKNTGISDWQGIGTGQVTDASKALEKLASSTGDATKGLGALGTNLATAFPAAPAAGGGGGVSWLSSLFGGIFKPNGAQATAAAAGTLKPGLFDRGGFTGHGGVNDPAGIVHRGEVVWSQGDVNRAGGVATVEAMRLGYRGYANGGPVGVPAIRPPSANANAGSGNRDDIGVHVFMDEDGNWQKRVEKIASQKAQTSTQQGFADFSQSQQRGGFGSTQSRWASQKG